MTTPKYTVTKITPKNNGKDFNFFEKVSVTNTTFGLTGDGYACDVVITFPVAGLIFNTEGSGASNTVEYSFNGNHVHGELVPGTNRATLTFLNRKVTAIWFRIKSGSTGPVTVSVEAWADA